MTTPSSQADADIDAILRTAMIEAGFAPQPPAEVERAAATAQLPDWATLRPPARDMRALLWSSIDNPESRDLDQVELAEQLDDGAIRMSVGIADVDLLVPSGSSLDAWAAFNATTVYAGPRTFSMLPERLSTDLTSLAEGRDRLAIVVSYHVGRDGALGLAEVYSALVRNHARLDYPTIGAWLAGQGQAPGAVRAVAGLEQQLRLQLAAAERLQGARERRGALLLETSEARAVVQDGQVVDLAIPERTPARMLIEELMVAANSVVAELLDAHGVAAIRRVVRAPERWPRLVELADEYGERLPDEPDAPALAAFLRRRRAADPDDFAALSLAVVKLLGAGEYQVVEPGSTAIHFALATSEYTHATAPNRRYVDLVTQRLIKAVIARSPSPYDTPALAAIAERCNDRQHAARSVERLARKVSAAVWMQPHIGQQFRAVVTGVSSKGAFVRLVGQPIEGKLVEGGEGVDVGDRVRVRLVDVRLEDGWIDFARVGG
jgi:exoribonuclease-2